jgi:hypothetical protein
VRYAGSQSWLVRVSEWEQQLEWALWMRAAERIPVPAGGDVPGPLDIDPLPEPASPNGEALVEGWLYWWRAALSLQLRSGQRVRDRAGDVELVGEGPVAPPDFGALDPYPELQRVVVARWPEMARWQGSRKTAGMMELHRASGQGRHRTGDVVRAVEAEVGHRAAPFELNLVFLPVAEDEIRGIGGRTFLVPERLRDTPVYEVWLHQVVRALA